MADGTDSTDTESGASDEVPMQDTDEGDEQSAEQAESENMSVEQALELSEEHPVLLFDGVCNLCNRSIQYVIERDPESHFRFAPLQSQVAQELLEASGYEGETFDSVVLVDNGEYYTKSDAVIRTARHLGGFYRVLGPFGVFPRRLRNVVYDFVANRRYNWFGKRDSCMMPTPDIRERFLAGGPGGSDGS